MKKNSISKDSVKKPKLLLYDLENAPLLGYSWTIWDTNIIEVKEDWFLLSIAYKWLGEKETHCIALPDFKGYKQNLHDDYKLVEAFHKVMEQADYLVAHNGDQHDWKKLNSRFLFHGMPPPHPSKNIDTLKIARRHFKFASNKLDDLGNVLGVGRKLAHTGKTLWLACMNGDLPSWKLMKAYNIQDVELLEKVYLKLRPYASNHPNINLETRAPNACPKCGSTHLQRRGRYKYTATTEAYRYQCRTCYGWTIGKAERIASRVYMR